MEKIVIDFPDMEHVKKEISELKEILKAKNKTCPEYLTANKASELLEIQKRTLSIYADKGEFRKYYFGEKLLYYKLSELYDFIENSALN